MVTTNYLSTNLSEGKIPLCHQQRFPMCQMSLVGTVRVCESGKRRTGQAGCDDGSLIKWSVWEKLGILDENASTHPGGPELPRSVSSPCSKLLACTKPLLCYAYKKQCFLTPIGLVSVSFRFGDQRTLMPEPCLMLSGGDRRGFLPL